MSSKRGRRRLEVRFFDWSSESQHGMLDNRTTKPGKDARGRHQRKEADKMRKLFVLGVLCLCGCQGVQGPFQPRDRSRVDDPRLPIAEQERRGRDRLALPDDTSNIAPRSGAAIPGTLGR
jgi:hypothetical protein